MVRQTLARRYGSRRRDWLAGEGQWPLVVPLGLPSEEEAQRQAAAVRAWVEAWRQWRGAGEVVWGERHWRTLGTQSLPERLRLPDAASVAWWIGESRSWQQAHNRYQRLASRWPELAPRLARHFEVLAEYQEADLERLEALLGWLRSNPGCNLYPRQLPIAGLDTKWLEPRMALLTDLLGQVDLRPLPHLVRFRLLDESLRRSLGGLGDISARVEDLVGLDLEVSLVYIVENLQTGLAFDDRPGSLVFMGLGYGVSALGRLPWVTRARCLYWGDLDTHGFAILDRARRCLPDIGSALMDEETLLRHREFWAVEKEQCAAAGLPLLTAAEQTVYRGLREQRWGMNVRLEQERIGWSWAWPRLVGGG